MVHLKLLRSFSAATATAVMHVTDGTADLEVAQYAKDAVRNTTSGLCVYFELCDMLCICLVSQFGAAEKLDVRSESSTSMTSSLSQESVSSVESGDDVR